MTQQPEHTDPIASAGQIDDPDQPTTVKGQDDSRAGRDTQPDEGTTEGDPDQPGATGRSAFRSDATHRGATADAASAGASHGERSSHNGLPPKAVQETGFPVVGDDTVDAQGARELDSEALAPTRRFQPLPGENNPNITDDPMDSPDYNPGSDRGRSAADSHATDHRHGTADRRGTESRMDGVTESEHVAGPHGGVADGAVSVAPDGSDVTGRAAGGRSTSGPVAGDRATAGADSRDGETAEQNTAQYEDPESMPHVEPVRHSRMVEERVQEQERDYDLETTEDGERYLTPKDLPES